MTPTLQLTGELVFFWYVVVPGAVLIAAMGLHQLWNLARRGPQRTEIKLAGPSRDVAGRVPELPSSSRAA